MDRACGRNVCALAMACGVLWAGQLEFDELSLCPALSTSIPASWRLEQPANSAIDVYLPADLVLDSSPNIRRPRGNRSGKACPSCYRWTRGSLVVSISSGRFTELSSASGLGWHSNTACRIDYPTVRLLRAPSVPVGGATLWLFNPGEPFELVDSTRVYVGWSTASELDKTDGLTIVASVRPREQ